MTSYPSRQGRPHRPFDSTLASPSTASAFTGHKGDTLASALIANGVHLMGRSFKYHRPRGVITAGAAEPNALVELREGGRKEANTRATMIELYDGLTAKSQNRWPSLDFDVGAVNVARLLDLRRGLLLQDLHVAEELLGEDLRADDPPRRRPRHGLEAPDPDKYEKAYAHCDLLVIGSGPTGLMAALAAARSGRRVILADEGSRARRLAAERARGDRRARPASTGRMGVLAELASMPNVTLMPRTTVVGWFDGNVFGAVERVNDHRAPCPILTSRASATGRSSRSAPCWRQARKSAPWPSAAMTCRA